ncbi:DUF1549 domain-containing protein [Planctomycetaceae bacterium SH139]
MSQSAPRRTATRRFLIGLLTVLVSVLAVDQAMGESPQHQDQQAAQDQQAVLERAESVLADWRQSIGPMLLTECGDCHGPAKQSGELSVRSLAALLGGGDRGETIDLEHPAESLLLRVLQPEGEPQMPPEGQLQPEMLTQLTRWVEQVAASDRDLLLELAARPVALSAEQSPGYPQEVSPRIVIEMAIEAGWSRAEKPPMPAKLCDDETFVRRIYLDLLGRVPTLPERADFLRLTDSRKRTFLIDQLLESPEHGRYLAEVFDAVLMGRGGMQAMKRRQQHAWNQFLITAFTENRPWDQVIRQILLARPTTEQDRGAVWYLYERNNAHQEIAEAISRGVFGLQIQCAQCHDHPLAEEIKQSHYWGLVAFYSRSKNVETSVGPRLAESAVGGFSMFTNLQGESQPNTLVFLQSRAVDEARPADGEQQAESDELYRPQGGEETPKVPLFSRREAFVEQIAAEHPLVARAMVNRLWALMMGRGLVHPVDMLDSVHPPSHPQLLAWLTDDFRRHGYNVRRLLRELAMSNVYQLDSRGDAFADPALFSRATIKPLTAEALYRSMIVALGGEPPKSAESPEQYAAFRQAFPDVLPEASIADLRQSLLLTNGAEIHGQMGPEKSQTVAELLAKPHVSEIVEEAFLRVLGRLPKAEEASRCREYLRARQRQPQRGIDQMLWALLTSAEFRFNH